MARKTDRVVLDNQARDITAKVYDFMKKEAVNNYAEKLTDARWRTAQACGVSERTVTRVLHERTHGIKPSTAPKNKNKKSKGVQRNKASTSNSNEASTSYSHESDTVPQTPMRERRMSL